MFFDVARGEALVYRRPVFEDTLADVADDELNGEVFFDRMDDSEDEINTAVDDNLDDHVYWDLMDENEDGDEGQTITIEADIAGLVYWNALCEKASHGSQHAPSAGTVAPAGNSSATPAAISCSAPAVPVPPVSGSCAVPLPAGSAVLAECEVPCEDEKELGQGWAGVTTGRNGSDSMGPGTRLTPPRTKITETSIRAARVNGWERTKKHTKTKKKNVPQASPLLDLLTAPNANTFSAPPRDKKTGGSTRQTSGPERTEKHSRTEKENLKPSSTGSQAATTASSRKTPLPPVDFVTLQDRRCRLQPAVKRAPLASLRPIPQAFVSAAPQKPPSLFLRAIGVLCASFARIVT
ncbi:hypothetical protein C8R47DRAFT_517636 [Mycena vitilis]|nr:hypothetical protein C8R47DRAFT_517636 [Mycena vitilis]